MSRRLVIVALGANVCAFCEHPAEHRHHFTARADGTDRYLDPESTIGLCHRCRTTSRRGRR